MNKTKMILCVTGGVAGLLVLAMAYFVWSAFSAKTVAIEGDDEEGTDGLEMVVEKAGKLARKPVYPDAESIKAIDGNRAQVTAWQEEALQLVSRGDRRYEERTPAQFKTFIVSDARRLASLPGIANGMLMKPEFTFGPFKDYIVGGMMPTREQLPVLQRQWDDFATVVELLAQGGIAEITDVKLLTPTADAAQETAPRGKKNRGKEADEGAELKTTSYQYAFTFTTRPLGFVKALNALETSARFVVVDGLTFTRGRDAIADAIGGDEKKADRPSGRRSRRGRAEAAAEKEEETETKNGIITDPLMDDPIKVEMKVTVYDFGKAPAVEEKAEEKPAEEKAGEKAEEVSK